MALMLDLTRVRGRKEHVSRRVAPTELTGWDDDFTVVDEVALSFDVEKDGERFTLTGMVSGTLELACSRCAESMRLPLESSFELRYSPVRQEEGQEAEVATEDLGTAFYEGDSIDLGQLIREQCYLALPMKPLCRPDCKGVCSECGVDRNRVLCECDHRWTDPRLEALRALLPKNESGPAR